MNTEYKRCDCQEDCYMYDNEEEQKINPCWGEVGAIDEIEYGDDWSWVHACRGHKDYYDGYGYKRKEDN